MDLNEFFVEQWVGILLLTLISGLIGFFAKELFLWLKKERITNKEKEIEKLAVKEGWSNGITYLKKINKTFNKANTKIKLIEKEKADWFKKYSENKISLAEWEVKSNSLDREWEMILNTQKTKRNKLKLKYPMDIEIIKKKLKKRS